MGTPAGSGVCAKKRRVVSGVLVRREEKSVDGRKVIDGKLAVCRVSNVVFFAPSCCCCHPGRDFFVIFVFNSVFP